MATFAKVTCSSVLFAQFDEVPIEYLYGGAAALAVVIMLLLIWWLLRDRRPPPEKAPPSLRIDVASLGDDGPPRTGPQLELFNIPVRLAAVILAPTGRGNELPINVDQTDLADAVVPGLMDIIHLHRSKVYRWPAQLSAQGFANTLFTNVPLPTEKGRGSPWSLVAGRVQHEDQNLLVGLVLCAETPNNLGQFVAERPTQWLDMLRVRTR
ncbi:MAG: hypothetical protein SGJ20_14190 [Planctomycetota bacterium]|nr:hypothetical protein [Planctomycetota bacterium]